MQMCPSCDTVYDESEYCRCPYCSEESEEFEFIDLCGTKKDKGKILQHFSDGGYLKKYKDGTTERVRFTKTREVHDFDGPCGKASIWSKRK